MVKSLNNVERHKSITMLTKFEPKTVEGLHKFRKEKHFYKEVIAIRKDNGRELLDAKFYGTAKMTYACFWLHIGDMQAYAGASAGGYGYDRSESALKQALQKSGIDWKGWADVEAVFNAIADHLGIEVYIIRCGA